MTVFGDGSQTRSFCYVDDQLARAPRSLMSTSGQARHMINVPVTNLLPGQNDSGCRVDGAASEQFAQPAWRLSRRRHD
ncbi:hypothetical protein [Mycobacterium sp. 852002-30065_SCH5024008]|uniref:hypothetical protein n=1 Tax=Mycobacterium sp. 852002-30065_SCH5024008 TaxID=1834088 RepID=UPI001E386B10|nr:hypothetical protein [Mycobacterium sp. 852002-30065_SCH5024008]